MSDPVQIAADVVSNWETSGAGYGDLEDRIESALRDAYGRGRDDEGDMKSIPPGWQL